jgi:hypothetical protein
VLIALTKKGNEMKKSIVMGDSVMCKRASSPNYNKAGVVMRTYVENTRQRHELAIVQYADGTEETTPIWRLSLIPDGDEFIATTTKEGK